MSDDSTRDKIRALNDQLRRDPYGGHGRIVATQSVSQRGSGFLAKALDAIAAFEAFTEDNNPYGENDFGSVDVDGVTLYFKIDYFDLEQRYHSEDASDAAKTTRVMTIMEPEDY